MSVLICFSKILERVIQKCLYKTYSIQTFSIKIIWLPVGHSTDHAILQLIDQINNNFKQSNFTLGVSIDLSKPFDTVDYIVLTKK